jgi:hypothetical protein
MQKESIMADLSTLKNKLEGDPQASRKFQSELLDILKDNAVDIDAPKVISALGLDQIDPKKADIDAGPSIPLSTKTQ